MSIILPRTKRNNGQKIILIRDTNFQIQEAEQMQTEETQGNLGQTCNKPLKTQLLNLGLGSYLKINEHIHLIE